MVLLIAEMIYFSASVLIFGLSGGLMKDLHNIGWTVEKISRLWAYYGSKRAYDNAYFSRYTGNRILSYIQRYIGLTKKQILDFGCAPLFLGRRLSLSKARGVFFGLDFSDESVIRTRQRLAGNIGYLIKSRFDSQRTLPSVFNLYWPQEVKYEKIFI